VKVVALAGGTGAAKLVRGLRGLEPGPELTVVVNTGDDAEVWGLHVSPDLDTICYALAGALDEARGWGLRGESFQTLDAMARFGEPTWFNLGDRDLATHLYRTRLLRQGTALSAVTRSIARALGVEEAVLPMSDEPVRTRLRAAGGWLDFQEYFVREKAQVAVHAVAYAGAGLARPAPGVLAAIAEADVVLICPSNPVTSIGPILAVPGIVEGLTGTAAAVVAVSPIVGGDAVSGPAGRLMASLGLPVSAAGVAGMYATWLDALVFDAGDGDQAAAIAALGVKPMPAPTMMRTREDEQSLARQVILAAR
jgi:LPPG:FO 2-phospho-L-lactate transferase